MDNLCHTLVGAAMGEAGLKRTTRFGSAALMVAANLPDVDVLAFVMDAPVVALRRGWTHGVLAQALLPVLFTGVVVAVDRLRPPAGGAPRVRPSAVLWLGYLGVLSHVCLDWLNTYGVRLLMPFSNRWFYGDSVFIVDPWLWLILAAGVLLARRPSRGQTGVRLGSDRGQTRVSPESGSSQTRVRPGTGPGSDVERSSSAKSETWVSADNTGAEGNRGGADLDAGAGLTPVRPGADASLTPVGAGSDPGLTPAAGRGGGARIALVVAALYIAAMIGSATAARRAVLDAWIAAKGVPPRALMVGPVPVNPLRKTIIIDAGDRYETGTFQWWPRRVAFAARAVLKRDDDPVVARARQHREIADILVWARFPYYEITALTDSTRVTVRDMRFGPRLGVGTVTLPR